MTIGIQQFDFSVDVLKFVFWQYDQPADENIHRLIQFKSENLQSMHTDFWNNWFRDVFNLPTANSFGIAVWAYILDVPLVVDDPGTDKIGWGFGPNRKNFFEANFATAGSGAALLTLDQRRRTLLLKYRKITSTGSVTDVNKILSDIFSVDGNVYLRDNLDMTVDYVFDFPVPAWVTFVAENYNVLPTPAAVSYTLEGP